MPVRRRPCLLPRIGAVLVVGSLLAGCSTDSSGPVDDGGQVGTLAVEGLPVEVVDADQPVIVESATVVDALGEAGLEARSHPATSDAIPGLAFDADLTGGLLFTVGNLGMKRSRTGHYVVLAFSTTASAQLFAAAHGPDGSAVFARDAWQRRAGGLLAGTLLAYAAPVGGDPRPALTEALRRLAGPTAADPSGSAG